MHLPHVGALNFFFSFIILRIKSCWFSHSHSCQRFSHVLQSFSKCFLIFNTVFLFFYLYSLDLVSHNYGILFTDFGGSLGLVVVGTVVLVGVSMDAAEQVTAATVEPLRHKSSKASTLKQIGGNNFFLAWLVEIQTPILGCCVNYVPVRPTLLRHIKQRFFLGFGVSPLPSSVLGEATWEGLEAAGWFTTTDNKDKKKKQKKGVFRSCRWNVPKQQTVV